MGCLISIASFVLGVILLSNIENANECYGEDMYLGSGLFFMIVLPLFIGVVGDMIENRKMAMGDLKSRWDLQDKLEKEREMNNTERFARLLVGAPLVKAGNKGLLTMLVLGTLFCLMMFIAHPSCNYN